LMGAEDVSVISGSPRDVIRKPTHFSLRQEACTTRWVSPFRAVKSYILRCYLELNTRN
jgi:hypothetical protein